MKKETLSRLGVILVFALAARASLAVKSAILPLLLTDLAFSPVEIGLVAGVGNVVAIFFSPWAGVVADRTSQRTLLTVSGISIGVSLSLFAVVGSLAPALAVAVFLAISTTFLRLSLIVSAVEVDSRRRASALGLLNALNAAGSSLGAIMAGWTADRFGYAQAFPLSALLIIGAAIIFLVFGNRKLAAESKPERPPVKRLTGSAIRQTSGRIALPLLFLLSDMAITVAWRTFLPIYLVDSLGWSAIALGGLIAAQNLAYSVSQPLSSYLTDRLGFKPSLIIGLAGYGILISLVPLATNPWSIYSLMLLSGILASPIYPTSLALAADLASDDERGTVMGLMMASSNLAGALGPSVAGLMVFITAEPSAGFAFCFVPALAVSLASLFLFRRSKPAPAEFPGG